VKRNIRGNTKTERDREKERERERERGKMPWNLPAVIEYAISILGFYFQRYQID